MLLRHSPTSPFVRKVVVLLHETGLADRVALETVDGWSEPDHLTDENPLSMVPTLVLEEGGTLFDSPVICEYLDRQHGGTPMIPADDDARWRVLRQQALADGMLDCAVLIFVEMRRRPKESQWDWWLELKRRAIERSLDWLDRELASYRGQVHLGTISIAVALAYLDLRGAIDQWRTGRPGLAAWYAEFAQRPSMIATAASS
jgi:glutathione S-transferase